MKRLGVATAIWTAVIVAVGLVAVPHAAIAASSSHSVSGRDQMLRDSADLLSALKSSVGEDLVLLGRVDQVRPDGGWIVLGQVVSSASDEVIGVGDYVAVLGEPSSEGKVAGTAVLNFGSMYVPGASQVYLKGIASTAVSDSGVAMVGSQRVDLTPTLAIAGYPLQVSVGSTVEISGSQPALGGIVVAAGLRIAGRDGSLGTGRTDGSLGTGRTDGSLGTGRTDGSLGTGRKTGSLGTGRVDGSLGTGRTDGSLGTGRTD